TDSRLSRICHALLSFGTASWASQSFMSAGRLGLTWYRGNSVPVADTSDVMPPRGSVTVRSGLSLNRQISGNSNAHPSNGIGMMQKPPKHCSGMSIASVRSRMSHLMSSSEILTVLSPRRSTDPLARWNLMWYEAVSGPSDALPVSSKTKSSRIALKSFVNAFSLAAIVRCGMSERLQVDERLQLVFFDRRIVRHRGIADDGRQLNVNDALE